MIVPFSLFYCDYRVLSGYLKISGCVDVFIVYREIKTEIDFFITGGNDEEIKTQHWQYG